MKWVYITAIIISLSIMGFVFMTLKKDDTAPSQDIVTPKKTISIIHAFKDGEHRFIGQVRLPHSCYALDAEAIHDQKDTRDITIVLRATDKMLDQSSCAKITTNYPFEILAEATEDIKVKASINGEIFEVKLTETSWQSGAGNYINPNTN